MPEIKSKKSGKTYNPDTLYEFVKGLPGFEGKSREQVWSEAQSHPTFEVIQDSPVAATPQGQTSEPPAMKQREGLGERFVKSLAPSALKLITAPLEGARAISSGMAGPRQEPGTENYHDRPTGWEGLKQGVSELVLSPVNAVKSIAGEAKDFYFNDTLHNVAGDPFRVLTDVASLVSGVGGLSKLKAMSQASKAAKANPAFARATTGLGDKMSLASEVADFKRAHAASTQAGQFAEGAFKVANTVDPLSLALRGTQRLIQTTPIPFSGGQTLPQLTYRTAINRAIEGAPKHVVDRMVEGSALSGDIWSGAGIKRMEADKSKAIKQRKSMTSGLSTPTDEIPEQTIRNIHADAANRVSSSKAVGAGAGTTSELDAIDATAIEPMLGDRSPGVSFPGRRRHPNPISKTDPRQIRAVNLEEAPDVISDINNRLDSHYEAVNKGLEKRNSPSIKTLEEIASGYRNTVDATLDSRGISGFKKLGQDIRNLSERVETARAATLGNSASTYEHGITAKGVANPSIFTSTYILDKTLTNPVLMTKSAAAMQGKNRGPVAKTARGARRVLTSAAPYEKEQQDSPGYQRFTEDEEQPTTPGSAVKSGQYQHRRFQE